jgi:DUF4097 and DUF4098 domain-containing protein YvlB
MSALSLKNIPSQVNAYVSSLTSHFKPSYKSKTIEQQYAVKNAGTLFVDVPKGNITVKSEWEKDAVYIKATIQTQKEEDLEKISLDAVHHVTANKKTDLTLATSVPAESKIKYHTDYEIIVPKKMNLNCFTSKGSTSILESSGNVCAKTKGGDITIEHTRGSIEAVSLHEGNISISNAHGPINAQANRGNIAIKHAHNSIVAYAKKGIITTNHGEVPPTNSITLSAEMGNIIVALPSSSTNAHLRCKTEWGSVYSEPYVQLSGRTTQLNKKSWRSFEKDVDAFMGNPAASHDHLAHIELKAGKGNIKILDNSVTT